MFGPGEYVPDVTEGIIRVEDLPKPRIERRSRNYPARRCPAAATAPDAMPLPRAPCTTWGTPLRPPCRSGCHLLQASLPPLRPLLRHRPVRPGLAQVSLHPPRPAVGSTPGGARTACPTKPPVGTSGATTASSSPPPPSRTGSRRLGKKKVDSISTSYLDEALADFSGYLAIDEVYDGPFCILSVVDNRRYNRLAFRVLDHDPTARRRPRFPERVQGAAGQTRPERARHHHGRIGALPQGTQGVVA